MDLTLERIEALRPKTETEHVVMTPEVWGLYRQHCEAQRLGPPCPIYADGNMVVIKHVRLPNLEKLLR